MTYATWADAAVRRRAAPPPDSLAQLPSARPSGSYANAISSSAPPPGRLPPLPGRISAPPISRTPIAASRVFSAPPPPPPYLEHRRLSSSRSSFLQPPEREPVGSGHQHTHEPVGPSRPIRTAPLVPVAPLAALPPPVPRGAPAPERERSRRGFLRLNPLTAQPPVPTGAPPPSVLRNPSWRE